MNAKEKEAIVEKVLLLCHFASRKGIDRRRILNDLRFVGGHELTEEELDRELFQLENADLIQKIENPFPPFIPNWGTTTTGYRWLSENNLV